jgi:hypothetical protein
VVAVLAANSARSLSPSELGFTPGESHVSKSMLAIQ